MVESHRSARLPEDTVLVPEAIQVESLNQFEELNQIVLEQVSPGDPDYENALAISTNEDLSQGDIEGKVREELAKRYWWLREYWQEKGLPKQQINIKTPFGEMKIFNFQEQLTEEYLAELQRIIAIFSEIEREIESHIAYYQQQIEEGKLTQPDANINGVLQTGPLKSIRDILVDNEQPHNPVSNEPFYGLSPRDGTIVIYPRAVNFDTYRIPGVRNFPAIVTHELTHMMPRHLFNAWQERFGWRWLDQPVELPGGAFKQQETDQPCLNSYAETAGDEDVCESVAAAIENPTILRDVHEAKLKFLSEGFSVIKSIVDKATIDTSQISLLQSEVIELPRVTQPVKYKVQKGVFVKIRTMPKESYLSE